MRRRRWEDELALDQLRPGVEPVYVRGALDGPSPDLSDVVAGRLSGSQHLLALWEPLLTKAPSPSRCQPYCCYARTVIFYHRPYTRRCSHPYARGGGRWGWTEGGFEQFDQIEPRLCRDDVVRFDGEDWDIGGGYVRWHRQGWWMRRWARRRAVSA